MLEEKKSMNESPPVETNSTDQLPPIPPRFPHKSVYKSVVVVLFLIVIVVVGYSYRDALRSTKLVEIFLGKNNKATSKEEVYRCPMHPQYTSNKPGECPICNMALVKDELKEEKKILYWVDPMNPNHRSDKPGKAPDGMDLVPVYGENGSQTNLPPGSVQITQTKQQLIGVTYGIASFEKLTHTLRAVGRIAYDETKTSRIHAKIEGWVEKVYVDFIGKYVRKGQPLIDLYSPDLLSTQQEFLLAVKAKELLSENSHAEIAAGSLSLYEAARKRLRLWDISDGEINKLEEKGEPTKALTLYAPDNGFVLTKNVFNRQKITPETELYTIVDLSKIWILAEIYEYEASQVKLGQTAIITLPYFAGQTFRGKITYIYPQVDPTTHTLKVRVEIPNSNFKLKPDMFVNVELKIDYSNKLSIPEEAILDSGTEQIIFIAHEGGYFEPRKVQLGTKVDDRYIVLSGLQAGEKFVTSGNFLIDSESRLKSAMSNMEGMHQHGEKDPSKPQQMPKEGSK